MNDRQTDRQLTCKFHRKVVGRTRISLSSSELQSGHFEFDNVFGSTFKSDFAIIDFVGNFFNQCIVAECLERSERIGCISSERH